MYNENLSKGSFVISKVEYSLKSLLELEEAGVTLARGEEKYVNRVVSFPLSYEVYQQLKQAAKYVGTTKNFKEIIDYFKVPEGETPAGFRVEVALEPAGFLKIDLVRDISYDKNGEKRPTKFLFSADSADPYEIVEIKNLIANLTCNPGIIYDLFINNPRANIGGLFKSRVEVIKEIGKILGPGVDISVELNNPFADSEQEILEEVHEFKEILSPYRVVIKVPHTGPVNSDNVKELLKGDKKFQRRFNEGTTKDMFHGHNLAIFLREHGYRVNFTLMFEPYQTALALQARPYFINSFVRHRMSQSANIKRLLDMYKVGQDPAYLEKLRELFIEGDYLSPQDIGLDLFKVWDMAERIIKYRKFELAEGNDGLDSVRHNLRLLKHTNLPDTRLIICSMEGDRNYPEIDKLLTEPEFKDMTDKIIITATPNYLARFTACNQVVAYQRRFMNAAKGQF